MHLNASFWRTECLQSNIAFLCPVCVSLQNITRINDIVKQALLVFPHFCLGRGLMDMAKNQAMATLYQNLGKMFTLGERSWDLRRKLMCVCLFRWRPLRKSSQLEHGGQESVCHGHSGGCHVRPDAAHPVQVLLQTHVRNTHPKWKIAVYLLILRPSKT